MNTLITHDIRVSVTPTYRPDHSNPESGRYVFSYEIIIENLSYEAVRLMRRHWLIQDSTGFVREVEGEGVIGQQPILLPGEKHQYASWCPLDTEIGRMNGTYLMRRESDLSEFNVGIPEFYLIAPYLLN